MENRININNYEAFLLDHMEGTLSAQDLALLKQFALEHPELNIDLQDTELLVLEPETFSLQSKNAFKKSTVSEELLFAYVENTLSEEEKISVEKTCAADPLAAKELKLFQGSILKADDSITFENKEALKKRSKVLWFNTVYFRTAAALLLLALTGLLIRSLTKNETTGMELVSNNNKTKSTPPDSLPEDTASANSNSLASGTTAVQQSPGIRNEVKRKTPRVIHSFTPLIALNKDSSKVKQESIVVQPPDTLKQAVVQNTTGLAMNNSENKRKYIISEGIDEEEIPASPAAEKKGLWALAKKALNRLNRLGIKKADVNTTKDEDANTEEEVLSLGNFYIKKEKYNQE